MKKGLATFLGIILLCAVYGQGAKEHLRAAQQFYENGLVEDAIREYTLAIQLEPRTAEIYIQRASCYLQKGDTLLAIDDYKLSAVFSNQSDVDYLKAAELAYHLNKWDDALALADQSLAVRSKAYEPWILKAKVFLIKDQLSQADNATQLALKAKENATTLYYRGLVLKTMGDMAGAETHFEKALIKDRNLVQAYIHLAEIQLQNGKYQYAVDNCKYALTIEPDNLQAMVLGCQGYHALHQPQKAITEISKAILISSSKEYFLMRADLLNDYGRYTEAINDYSVVLAQSPELPAIYKSRAEAYEKLGNSLLAARDYQKVIQLLKNSEATNDLRTYAEKRVYELNKENNKPGLHISQPTIDKDEKIPVDESLTTVHIAGYILVESIITEIKINNQTIEYDSDSIGHASFSADIDLSTTEFITITASDIYGNTNTNSFPIHRIERQPPAIVLNTPYSVNGSEISIDLDDQYLYLEGMVQDKSKIQSIQVDEVNASFAPGELNPRFTATIDLKNRKNIVITATDQYNNTSKVSYTLVADNSTITTDNPMGKTWVVLIENSEYNAYPNLRSPSRDMSDLKAALSGYQISNIIHKRNMGKRELERFFAIDLRDLIRSNQVKSLLIWYAGHGTYMNETGYWIPVDAGRDEEFDYFNMNALKASLYSYQTLDHLLVISDACEAGAAFNVAMRGNDTNPSCNEVRYTESRSAQVFTSTTEGYALDNSTFTDKFIQHLSGNSTDCIPIDKLATVVTNDLRLSTGQVPVFGRIPGLKDDQGTFFFIKK